MQIYYFLNNISKESFNLYIKKFDLLNDIFSVSQLIEIYYAKVDKYIKDAIQDANFFEALCFIEFIKKEYKLSYKDALEKINWIYDDNFFIYNEKIFIEGGKNYKEIDVKNEKVYFVTSRDLFSAPFFLVLNSLSEINKNIEIVKFNIKLNKWSFNDKAYYISKLYKYREKYIGDIVFPLFQNKDNDKISNFFTEIKKLLGERLILKKNFGNMGEGVKAIDLNNFGNEDIELLKNNFLSVDNNFTGVYLMPFIDINNEYRIYYRYNNKKKNVKIYSVKQRINEEINTVFSKKALKIYKDVKVKWLYIVKNKLDKKYIDNINKICRITESDIGVLEIIEDKNGKIYFSEINYLGGSLMFSGQDEKDMINYYTDTWKMIY